MDVPQIVIDTNILVAGLRSRRGSAFRLLSLVGHGQFDIHVSVPLILEYEEVLTRQLPNLPVTSSDISNVIDFHCKVATRHQIYFLWRPTLSDPCDDMLLEVAVTARCDFIVTFNTRDFAGVERFGLRAISPAAFLQYIGVVP